MKKLPIGIQTFKEIIVNDYIYIDKTDLALEVIQNYKYSFLSRPRRFGKSLFLDTLKNIFEGNKELFKDLDIYNKWDFKDIYPVIKIDWAGDFKTLELTKETAIQILKENQKRLDIECEFQDSPSGNSHSISNLFWFSFRIWMAVSFVSSSVLKSPEIGRAHV